MTPSSTQRMMTALPLLMEISSSLTQRRMLMSPLLIQRMMSPLSTQMTMLILLVQMTMSPLLMQQYHLLLKGEPVHSLFWRIHWPSGTANAPPFRRSNTQTDQEATGLAIIAVAEIIGRHWDLLKDSDWYPPSEDGTGLKCYRTTSVCSYFYTFPRTPGSLLKMQVESEALADKSSSQPWINTAHLFHAATWSFPDQTQHSSPQWTEKTPISWIELPMTAIGAFDDRRIQVQRPSGPK